VPVKKDSSELTARSTLTTGTDCEINIDDCDPNPCLSGGNFTDLIDGYSCMCPPGFVGENCETETTICTPDVRICPDGTSVFRDPDNNCEFFLCPTNIDDCDPNPCLNGGTCTNGANNYTCTCAAGFEANNCETKVDDCDPNPCLNGGTCRDGVNSYTIFCLSNCEINIDICNPNPCLKDGTCTVGVNGFSCRCLPGFSGDTCEKNIDDCIPNPCLNGGTCEDGINNYTCTCAEEYEGTNCENKYPRKILGGSKPINL
jgi:hypothetical protein